VIIIENINVFESKNAIFTDDTIIIKKNNVIIPVKQINRILYAKWTFKNYLCLGIGDVKSPGALYIYLDEKINNKKMYCFFIRYKNVMKLPQKKFMKIKFYGKDVPWY